MRRLRKIDGFSLVEIVMIFSILVVLFGMILLTIENRFQHDKEEKLKQGLAEVRKALRNYYLDHKHFPCDPADYNRGGDVELFKKQLLWYTNYEGKPSLKRSEEFRFGPYLTSFPVETISGSQTVRVDTSGQEALAGVKKRVAESPSATGGWYYQAANGLFIANLNKDLFKQYYAYF